MASALIFRLPINGAKEFFLPEETP